MFAQLLVSALAFNGPAALMTRGAPGSSITMAAKKAVKPVKAVKAVKASKPVKATKAPKPQADYGISGGFLESGGVYDPLNYAAGKDINRLRSVELKNGRICMLATLGYVVQEVYSWPNDQGYFDGSNPITTFATVPVFGVLQILLVCGLIEINTGNEWQTREPGDIGFDPLGLAKNGINPAYADAELKHARLAMVGWLGFVTQSLVTGKGVLATTFDKFS